MSVPYGRYEEAFRAIHSALWGLMAPVPGKRITKLEFTWNADSSLATLSAYEAAVLLFTLTFTWNVDGTLKEVTRTDA
jgi:hypothetical protein